MPVDLLDYLNEALALLKTELKLLKLQIQYPDGFKAGYRMRRSQRRQHQQHQPERQIYLTSEVSQVDLMEIISGIHYRKLAVDILGRPVPLSWLVEGFEILFNIKIGDLYKREEAIFERDQSLRTAFLDSLRTAIRKKGQYRGDLNLEIS